MLSRLGATGVALMLGACASSPMVQSIASPPGVTAAPTSYRMADAADPASRAALPEVEQRLRAFGFLPGEPAKVVVTVSTTERDRTVGAYVPGCASEVRWEAATAEKKLFRGRRLVELRVTISDAATGRELYRSQAAVRTDQGTAINEAPRLAEAALAKDPRLAPVSTSADCTSR